jgi:hypothetical protein
MDITVKLSGDRTKNDRAVGKRFGEEENSRRQAEADTANTGKNVGDPGYVTPVILPLTTNAEIDTAYEVYLTWLLTKAHDSYLEQQVEYDVDNKEFKNWWRNASDADKAAFKTLSGL